jgi:hypothetical protein
LSATGCDDIVTNATMQALQYRKQQPNGFVRIRAFWAVHTSDAGNLTTL